VSSSAGSRLAYARLDVEQDEKAGGDRGVDDQTKDGDGGVGIALVGRRVLR
jgi:hypothetical protein